MKKRFLAHQGPRFSIEWYNNERGRVPALEYYEKLTQVRKNKTQQLFGVLGLIGKIFNKEKFRYEGDQIFAIKASQDRFSCFFFTGEKIIITNAYEKKSNKMPKSEKEKALKAKNDYMKRYKLGEYYD